MPWATLSGETPGGAIQNLHIIHSGPRQVPVVCCRGDICPLSNGHHFSFALPTVTIIHPPFLNLLRVTAPLPAAGEFIWRDKVVIAIRSEYFYRVRRFTHFSQLYAEAPTFRKAQYPLFAVEIKHFYQVRRFTDVSRPQLQRSCHLIIHF